MTDLPIQLEAADSPLLVNGDAGRLEQVLLNLLTNAITHARGTDRIDVRLRRAGDEAEIAVQDYGPGIPQADLPNIFSRFYQVAHAEARAQRGLGLGLFIVHELVTAHGGTVAVASAEGQGTTFTIRLPRAAQIPT
jgi:signal transduction histidine kinase